MMFPLFVVYVCVSWEVCVCVLSVGALRVYCMFTACFSVD